MQSSFNNLFGIAVSALLLTLSHAQSGDIEPAVTVTDVPFTATTTIPVFPPGFKQMVASPGKALKVLKGRHNFEDAKSLCQQEGGQLFTIGKLVEVAEVQDDFLARPRPIWLGLNIPENLLRFCKNEECMDSGITWDDGDNTPFVAYNELPATLRKTSRHNGIAHCPTLSKFGDQVSTRRCEKLVNTVCQVVDNRH
mmetsp:Transcript_34255/g.56144  ORF Transcript_34255/g.56144 Transcript_34255/m.56144 type:complete len:196 (-) Transcript_34255:83-670(-)